MKINIILEFIFLILKLKKILIIFLGLTYKKISIILSGYIFIYPIYPS